MFIRNDQQHVDRGSMEMVRHHVIYSPDRKENSGQNQNTCNHTHIKYNAIKWLLTLFVPILLHYVQMGSSCSSFFMLSLPLLGFNCLSFPILGRLGPASPPPFKLVPFPPGSMQQPISISGTENTLKINTILTGA
jgi:hypothetical protein